MLVHFRRMNTQLEIPGALNKRGIGGGALINACTVTFGCAKAAVVPQ